jgi:hypothetical protein
MELEMTSPANNRGTLNAYINNGLNGMSNFGIFILNKSGTLVAPAVLGSIGGWLTGVGSQIGLFQGLTSGVYHVMIHKPVSTYVANNEGNGKDDIHPKTARFLQLIGLVAGIAVPILITYYCGAGVMNKISSKLGDESYAKWLIGSEGTRDYSLVTGIAVNIAPALVQHWISWWRDEDETNKRK